MKYSAEVSSIRHDGFPFMVISVQINGQSVTLVGEFAFKPRKHTTITFEAKESHHPKFGKQLKMVRGPFVEMNKDTPDDYAASLLRIVKDTVPSELVHRKLRDFWSKSGSQSFIRAFGNADLLQKTGLTSVEAFAVIETISSIEGINSLQETFPKSVPATVAKAAWKKFGSAVSDHIQKNPYVFCEVPGFEYVHADEIMLSRKAFVRDSDERKCGVLISMAQKISSQGHTCIPVEKACDYLEKITRSRILPTAQLRKSTHIREFDGFIGLTHLMEVESACAIMLAQRMVPPEPQTKIGGLTRDAVVAALEQVRDGLSIELTDKQCQGVYNAIFNRVSIITGLPGTGKTTSLKMLIQVLDVLGIQYSIAAPTGIAAKRVSIVTGAIAGTIHRIFGAQKSQHKDEDSEDISDYFGVRESSEKDTLDDGFHKWAYDQSNPYPADLVVIDESSMVDIKILMRILEATKPSTHLVFVGDPAQLPSVGPGNILRDLIDSKKFATIQLMDIFRQADTSDIVLASHDIFHGNFPEYPGSNQFTFVKAETDEEVHNIVVRIAKKLHDESYQYQILAPRHGGVIGVTAFNESLRDIFNPQTAGVDERKIGNSTIRVRDRILVTKNDYNYNVFNGDIGKVLSFTTMEEGGKTVPAIEVQIYNDPPLILTIPLFKAVSILRLAYAMTVHKFQGLEHDVIVIPVMNSYSVQLQRNLYYTAITRAVQRVILVGDPNALARAIANTSGMERHTRLASLLEEA